MPDMDPSTFAAWYRLPCGHGCDRCLKSEFITSAGLQDVVIICQQCMSRFGVRYDPAQPERHILMRRQHLVKIEGMEGRALYLDYEPPLIVRPTPAQTRRVLPQ